MQRWRALGGASGGFASRVRAWFGQYRRFDASASSTVVAAELLPQAAAASPLYIGADGQAVVYLGAVAPAAKYLGPRTLF